MSSRKSYKKVTMKLTEFLAIKKTLEDLSVWVTHRAKVDIDECILTMERAREDAEDKEEREMTR